jgi:exonuclease VII small subunit
MNTVEKLKQVLEALEQARSMCELHGDSFPKGNQWHEAAEKLEKARADLSEVIEQMKKQEPFGYITRSTAKVKDAQKVLPDEDPVWLWSSITFGTKDLEQFESYDDLEVLRLYTPPAPAAQPAPAQKPVATIFGSLPVYDTSPAKDQLRNLTNDEFDALIYADVHREPMTSDHAIDVTHVASSIEGKKDNKP